MSWKNEPDRQASFQTVKEQRIQQAINATEKERAEIKEVVLESAVELTGGGLLRTASPAMLATWWLEVFDKLRLQDLVFTERECRDKVDDALYEESMGDDL